MNVELKPTLDKYKIFEDELLPHADALRTFAVMLTKNEADADDLVQDTLLRAFKALDSYEPGTYAKAWLFRILRNGFINNYRKKVSRPTQVEFENVNLVRDEEENTPYEGYHDMRVEMFQGMLGDELVNAMSNIPSRFLTPVLLCDVEGFTYEEIASIVDAPLGTVRSRLYRGRNLLKDQLKEYAKSLGLDDNRS